MRAVCYSRVSSAGQAERGTIESQFRDLPALVTRQGWRLVRPVETYVDDGRTARSGHLAARTGFASLLRDAAAGLFDVVVVADLDRLTRAEDMTERGAILGAFQRAGVKVAIASSGQVIDLSSSFGDLLGTLQAFFAAEENRKRTARTIAGRQLAVSRGRLPSGPRPYGLAYSSATGQWSIDPVAGPIAREIVERVAKGDSTTAIAEDLVARAAPRPRGGPWSREKVWHVATRQHLTGRWIADKARGISIEVPPVVDEETWQLARARFTELGKRGLRRTKHSYLLEGLAICELCGEAMRVDTGRQRRWSNYSCRTRLYSNGCRAMFRVEDVDARVWEAISRDLADPQLAERITAGDGANRADADAWKRDLADYQRKLGRLESEVEPAILARYRRRLISQTAMDRELTALGKERRALERQIEAARAASQRSARAASAVDEVRETLARAAEGLAAATAEERAALVKSIVAPGGAVVGDTIKLTLRIPPPGQRGAASGAQGATAACSSTTRERLEFRIIA
jgi:site-specific DNA recombinase